MNIKQTFSFFIILLMLFPSVASAPSTVEDGFTGYYEVTSTLSSGENITVPEGADRVDVSVAGDVPEYQAIVEDDVSTYPQHVNMVAGYECNNGFYDFSGNGNNITNQLNVGYFSEYIEFNGSGYITVSSPMFYIPNELTVYMELTSDSTDPATIVAYNRVATGVGGFAVERGTSQRLLTMAPSTATPEYLYSPNDFLTENVEKITTQIKYGEYIKTYKENILSASIGTTGTFGGSNTSSLIIGARSVTQTGMYTGKIYKLIIYNTSISEENISALNNGFSGIQISSTPYTGTTLTLPENTSEVEYIATDDEDREVTVRAYYSNAIEVEEIKSDSEITILINHTASTTTGAGYIEYEPINYPVYHLDMSTDNPNASFTYSSGLINISTGYITGDTDYQYILTGYDRYDYTKYSISGNVFDADTLEPIGNISVTLDGYAATTNTTGYYLIDGIYNGTYTISFVSEDYTLKYQPVTISGTNITDLDIYLNEDTNQKAIPLMMFYMLMGVFIFLVLMTFRGIREDGVYIDNLIFGAFLVIQSFYMSKIIINGTVVEMSTFITDTNTVITHTTPVVSSSLGTFFEFFGIVTVFALIYMLYSFIQERKLIEDEWN